MKNNNKTKRNLLIETNRRLQETTQELFMAKQDLEKKNKELEEARKREREQKEKLEYFEDAAMKHLAGPGIKKQVKPSFKKKLTESVAENLSLRYITLLESYVKTKDLDKNESLVEEFCQKLIEYGITPKGIINTHLKAVPQIRTINDLETKRVTFESRMVLLKVMTQYASILLKNKEA